MASSCLSMFSFKVNEGSCWFSGHYEFISVWSLLRVLDGARSSRLMGYGPTIKKDNKLLVPERLYN